MFFSAVVMHIPDGFLSLPVSLLFWLLSLGVIGLALRMANRTLGERQVPLMGVMAAAIFAGQMLNFTILGGTSGHLLGAALATILLGPWSALLVMTAVISVQALIFQDGGLLVLGANLFNMGVVGVAVSAAVYLPLCKLSHGKRWGMMLGGFLAAWLSVECSALLVGLQLALSGTSPANLSIPAMGGIHALIGLVEGAITTGALAFLYAARRDLFETEAVSQQGTRGMLLAGMAVTLLLVFLAPFASVHPDGLESVAERLGFSHQAAASPLKLLAGYQLPGIHNQALATILAGVVGVLAILGVSILASHSRNRDHSSK